MNKKLNELKQFLTHHEKGSYDHKTAFQLWTNIMNKINELEKEVL